jgi:hypothetical protein
MYRGVLGVICASALASSAAFAADVSSGPAAATFEITGFVPVICRANLQSNVVQVSGGETKLGALNEFCNSPRGYQVFVETSPELSGATLIIDGREVPLSDSGPILVSSSEGPATASRDVRIASGGGSGSLNFRIVPR